MPRLGWRRVRKLIVEGSGIIPSMPDNNTSHDII